MVSAVPLAAASASGDRVPCVRLEGLGTGRADAGPAVATGLEQHPDRLLLGGVGLADLASACVGLLHGRPAGPGRPGLKDLLIQG
jgi:hypothetical protein